MKKQEKIDYLFDNHSTVWLKERTLVANDLSESQSMFCCCGKLATGLHENTCRKFSEKVSFETLKRLSYLIPK